MGVVGCYQLGDMDLLGAVLGDLGGVVGDNWDFMLLRWNFLGWVIALLSTCSINITIFVVIKMLILAISKIKI
jgi:hypothetical protein